MLLKRKVLTRINKQSPGAINISFFIFVLMVICVLESLRYYRETMLRRPRVRSVFLSWISIVSVRFVNSQLPAAALSPLQRNCWPKKVRAPRIIRILAMTWAATSDIVRSTASGHTGCALISDPLM